LGRGFDHLIIQALVRTLMVIVLHIFGDNILQVTL